MHEHSDGSPDISAPQPERPGNQRLVVIYVIAFGVFTAIAAWLIGWSSRDIFGFAIFMGVLFGIVFLIRRYPKFREWFERSSARVSGAYASFLGLMAIAFIPAWLLTLLNRLVVTLSRPFQIFIFVVWGVVLSFLIWLVATERRRLQLFAWLEKGIGRFTPVAYSFNLLMIAVIFFSSITYLSARDRMRSVRFPDQAVTVSNLQDFYLWHFIDALPLLKVTDTIAWKKPMNFEGNFVGWILLLFKLTVIIPVIACFVSYWKNFASANKTTPSADQSRRMARSAGRYTRRAGGLAYYRRTARGYGRSSH